MHVATLIQGVGSVGYFSSRAFLPAFATALFLRLGPEIPGLGDTGLLDHIEGAPTWFTSNLCLVVLGLLSALELAANKSSEARQLLQEIDQYVKPVMAALTFMGVASASDAKFIEENVVQAGVLDLVPALILGLAVFFFSVTRSRVLSVVSDADPDDDAAVQGLFSWAEDVWSLFAPLLLILFPLLMILLIAMVAAVMMLLRKWAEVREERSKQPCGNCGEPTYGTAMSCAKCKTAVAAPRRIGFLGQSKPDPEPDLNGHPYRLVQHKRCPVCATRFPKRSVHQTCSACGHELMGDPDFAKAYLNRIDARLPLVLVVTFLFSLVPVVGLIPGVIYYRITLIAPLRRYIPLARSFLLKWLIRLLLFLLIACQWVPIVGGLVVPVMALISYCAYRSTFKRMLPRES